MTCKAIRILLFLSILTGLTIFRSYSSDKESIRNRISLLPQISPEDMEDSVRAIIRDVYYYDQLYGRQVLEKMISELGDKSPKSTFVCLETLAAFSPGGYVAMYDSAYRYARAKDLDYRKLDYYLTKSHFFRLEQQYDSSMNCLLTARELAKKTSFDDYVMILYQLGDIYYGVNLFKQAEHYYRMVDSLKGNPEIWNHWMRFVIHNNLALIEFEKEEYDKAIAMFRESEKTLPFPLRNYADSMATAYCRRMIAANLNKKGLNNEALEELQLSWEASLKYRNEEQLFGTYLLMIRLYIALENQDEALRFYKMFLDDFGNKNLTLNDQIERDLLSAELHDFLGNYSEAVSFFKKYKHLNDSLNLQLTSAGILQLLSEKDFQQLEMDYHQTKMTRLLLMVIVAILLVSAGIIFHRSRKVSRLNRQLSETNKTKDKLFSIISHDLRSPFQSILGLSELMTETITKGNYENAVRYSETIHLKSTELYSFIENILNWSRFQRGIINFVPEDTDLALLINDVVHLYQRQAEKKEIQVETQNLQQVKVRSDKMGLFIVISNLLSNAIKFTPRNGKVSFSTRSDFGRLFLSISDTGVGIPENRLATLFELQNGETTAGTENEQGTGLGLLICREFTEKNGGTLKVISKPGEGTTVELTLIKVDG